MSTDHSSGGWLPKSQHYICFQLSLLRGHKKFFLYLVLFGAIAAAPKPFPFLTSNVVEGVSLSLSLSVILLITGTRTGAVVKGLKGTSG